MIKKYMTLVVLSAAWTSPAFARAENNPLTLALEKAPSFTATCDDLLTKAYYFHNGQASKWVEGFNDFTGNTFEVFEYAAEQPLSVRLKESVAHVVAARAGIMIVIELALGVTSISSWQYAINWKARRIVASEVNAYWSQVPMIGSGVKGRTVELDCDFIFD